MPALCSTRSRTSAAMCSLPGGFVVSSRTSSWVRSTTVGATTENLADGGDRKAALDGPRHQRMPLEMRIGRQQLFGLLPDLVHELWLLQRPHGQVREAMLPLAHQLTHAADAHVLLGEAEPVGDGGYEPQPVERLLGRIVREQQGVALLRAAADPAAELVQLGEAESI